MERTSQMLFEALQGLYQDPAHVSRLILVAKELRNRNPASHTGGVKFENVWVFIYQTNRVSK